MERQRAAVKPVLPVLTAKQVGNVRAYLELKIQMEMNPEMFFKVKTGDEMCYCDLETSLSTQCSPADSPYPNTT